MALRPINPEHARCQACGEKRRFWRNCDGLEISRCGSCELENILAYLRREHGPSTNVQFMMNTGRTEKVEFERFVCPTCGGDKSSEMFLSGIRFSERICGNCGEVYDQLDSEFLRSCRIAPFEEE
jgi:hypothetical protein